MLKISRRQMLGFTTALIPGFLLTKLDAAQAHTIGKATPSTLGALLTKSSAIQVGQIQIFTGTTATGQSVEVVLTRTKKGLFALNGACTHQGCGVAAQGNQLVCPCHGSVFKADTGAVISGPRGSSKTTIGPLIKYHVTESKGNIYIK
ncbi:MAG TPA: Rieske (2Fe-2S) protein [Candidatus Nanopelagicaceae bacterium]